MPRPKTQPKTGADTNRGGNFLGSTSSSSFGPPTCPDREVMTLAEAADYLGVEQAEVERLAESGDLPGRRIGDEWRFSRAAIEDWLRPPPSGTKESLLASAGSCKDLSEESPSIVATPGVCGGAACLIRTRIPVWTIERMRQLGVSEIDILRSYPNLKARDLVEAWAYVTRHKNEIEKAIRENEADDSDVPDEALTRANPST